MEEEYGRDNCAIVRKEKQWTDFGKLKKLT